MLFSRLFCAAAILLPAPVATADVRQSVVSPEAIVQVICPTKDGWAAGTAFRVGNGLLLSVNHVTNIGTCRIAGVRVRLSYASPTADFSMLHGDKGPFLTVDCGGFVRGRHYIAVGFARGLPFLTTVDLVATGQTDDDNGEAILAGIFAVAPGMSGGAILDAETGRVVGVINAENFERGLSWSVELKRTPVCAQRIA